MMKIFTIAESGMQAAQLGLATSSMNIANLLTPGYSRQQALQSSVESSTQSGLSAGNGVQVERIRRIAGQYVIEQVWQTGSKANYYQIQDHYGSALESVISSESASLGNGLDQFFAGLNALSTEPENQANRQQWLNQAKMLATRFNNLDHFIDQQQVAIQGQRDTLVRQINTLAAGIAGYNQQISDLEFKGASSNLLRDQRDELVQQLSQMTEVRVLEDAVGRYTVALKNGEPLVSGKQAGVLKSDRDSAGNPRLTLKVSGSEFALNMASGGQLGGLYEYQTGTFNTMRQSIRGMAQTTADLFNQQLAAGFDKNGNPGRPLFDTSNPTGILQVTDLDAEQLALSGKAGEVGNGDNLQRLIAIKNKQALIEGLGTISLNQGAAAIIARIGISSRQNKIELEAALEIQQQAGVQRNNLSAVNQDEEAMHLQEYLQVFQSNAKVIAIGNQLFNDLLRIL